EQVHVKSGGEQFCAHPWAYQRTDRRPPNARVNQFLTLQSFAVGAAAEGRAPIQQRYNIGRGGTNIDQNSGSPRRIAARKGGQRQPVRCGCEQWRSALVCPPNQSPPPPPH